MTNVELVIIRSKNEDDISERTENVLHPEMLERIIKKQYSVIIEYDENTAYDDVFFSKLIIESMKENNIQNIDGHYSIWEKLDGNEVEEIWHGYVDVGLFG